METNAAKVLIDDYNNSNRNLCLLLNVSSGNVFLSVLVNGNKTRGIKAKILMNVNGSNTFKLKTKDNTLFLEYNGDIVRCYCQHYSYPSQKMSPTDIDLSDATTVEYI